MGKAGTFCWSKISISFLELWRAFSNKGFDVWECDKFYVKYTGSLDIHWPTWRVGHISDANVYSIQRRYEVTSTNLFVWYHVTFQGIVFNVNPVDVLKNEH